MRFVAAFMFLFLSSPALASEFYCGKDFITFTAAEAGDTGILGEGRIATVRKSQIYSVLGPGKIGDTDGLGQLRISPPSNGENEGPPSIVWVEESMRVKIIECL